MSRYVWLYVRSFTAGLLFAVATDFSPARTAFCCFLLGVVLMANDGVMDG